MNERSSGLFLELRDTFEASCERVFELLTDPVDLARWWGPRGFTIPEASLDLHAGGSYRFSMQPPEGELFHLSGEFLEVDPPARLVYTFRWDEPTPDDTETVVTFALEARGDATEVALSHGPFATGERLALHLGGWTDSFDRLRQVIAGSS